MIAPEANCWPTSAMHALVEAHVMSESIRELVRGMIDEGQINFSMLEAVDACAQRLESVVVPVVDAGLPQ